MQYNWAIFLAGLLCIYINYDCDRQRQVFRKTQGKCKIWGKVPSKVWCGFAPTRSCIDLLWDCLLTSMLLMALVDLCILRHRERSCEDEFALDFRLVRIFGFLSRLQRRVICISVGITNCLRGLPYRWGVARHFHYAPEIAAAFFWSLPAQFVHVTPKHPHLQICTPFRCLSLTWSYASRM